MKKIHKLSIIAFIFVVFLFFQPFLFRNMLPVPADTIIGLYHPFRDLYAKQYPNGIPFKNFLITDPVRQQYPWRELSIDVLKRFELPTWNPYSLGGTPLLANFQSAPFYPLNILFIILPFNYAWSVLVLLQPVLAGLFLYLYLSHMRLAKLASLIGAIAFAFSGFSIAWLEWNTILHTALWLPLILLAIDQIFSCYRNLDNSKFPSKTRLASGGKIQNSKLQLKSQKFLVWSFIFIFSLIISFLAGHLQTFFYIFFIVAVYFILRWFQYGKIFNILFVFFIFAILFLLLTSIQWIPTLQFILQSARDIDQSSWQQEGWFIPWQHLIQFVAPDFFGNPTTLNYWGVWNYAEFIGFIGILPLIMALYAIFFRHDKKTLFFGTLFFLSLIFSLPTILAKLPYMLNIPFLSTSQPTRLLFVTDFSLAILAAFGIDYFIKKKEKIIYPLIFMLTVFIGLWIFVFFGNKFLQLVSVENIDVSKRNLLFPTIIFIAAILIILLVKIFPNKKFIMIMYPVMVALTILDLFRFGTKFTPFTNTAYLFPQTKTIEFLQNQQGIFRIMTTDSRILPPNFSIMYKLQSVDGYDPLYLRRYGELIAASQRGKPDISPPFGFNRIITPHNHESRIIDLLGVKYVLSLSDFSSPNLQKVFQEGQTRVYENVRAFPRAFFVKTTYSRRYPDNQTTIEMIINKDIDLKEVAIVEFSEDLEIKSESNSGYSIGRAEVVIYTENKVQIKTQNDGDGFLIFTDSFYPTWHARIDNKEIRINRADYNFRGVVVPKGNHIVEFYNSLF